MAAGIRRRWQQRPVWPRRWRPRGQHVVLLYHRIADVDQADDPGGMVVPPELFRQHMTALRDWFDLVPAREVLAPHERPTAAVTLDDGYLDNLEQAVPLLRQLGVPATFFIVADALQPDPPEYWWDRLEHLVLEPGPGADRVRVTAGRRVLELDLATRSSAVQAYRDLSAVLQRQGHGAAVQALTTLEAARPRPQSCARHRRLSAEQVRALAEEPLFDVGSHTCTHSALAALPRQVSREELTRSRQRLADLLGEAPELVAYPYGSVGAVVRRNAGDARSAGYRAAFTNVAGPVEGSPAYAVPRITVGRWSVEQLHAAVTAFRRPE
ncbi:polysaccharide deacetylase [Geodermatophilus obscurus DSM 43160]|uniref:Polysaccharide deacetylase n=1 Tax=Geodermatophilus obscurus (strain ATCC 25078 / DSM 43160 / JCM 3152 / CCUG 61914 / KCC A-0152 / KCTC 9177 / NBRC 13315 / NRRL B-3577 / G-20) TaxID=526225 RepID=D2S586_GEOOG|nr:polysaccharide deacetylase [Geodermatophilus obscurus DSM 43160]